MVHPVLAETDEEANAKRVRMVSSLGFIERALASIHRDRRPTPARTAFEKRDSRVGRARPYPV